VNSQAICVPLLTAKKQNSRSSLSLRVGRNY